MRSFTRRTTTNRVAAGPDRRVHREALQSEAAGAEPVPPSAVNDVPVALEALKRVVASEDIVEVPEAGVMAAEGAKPSLPQVGQPKVNAEGVLEAVLPGAGRIAGAPLQEGHGIAGDRVRGLRGVSPAEEYRYRQEGLTCQQHGVSTLLSLGHVNNNYCDCDDGLDEPGTSACAGQEHSTGFWCAVEGELILSSRINDGVADCCDCTDEWGRPELVCEPRGCDVHRQRAAEARARLAEGHALFLQLRTEGERKRLASSGPLAWDADHDAYHALEDTCLEHAAGGYDYRLCFFKELSQTSKADGNRVTIGRNFAWHALDRNTGELRDGDRCFEVGPRQATVIFSCALRPVLERIEEPERCHYRVTVGTPAACSVPPAE